jgi:phosphomannomutase
MYFLFDVDGTLTPAREKITAKFHNFFLKFCEKYPVSLVSGSDYIKTQEQLGEEILEKVEYSFNCSGNAVYKKGELVHYSDWRLGEAPRKFLKEYLEKSEYPIRTGNHLEERIGAVNFSVLGRNANMAERLEYYRWDDETEERALLVEEINRQFTGIEAVIGGQIGIDIYQRGCDKSQVLKWYRDKTVIYFGDKCYPGGNDYPLVAKLSKPSKYYSVKKWQETYGILKKNYPI